MASRRPLASRLFSLLGLVAGVVIVIDQVTKTIAVSKLGPEPVHLTWTLQLNLSFNSGAAFSVGPGLTPIITAVGVVLVAGLLVMARRVESRGMAIALGLVLGGAASNLIDRLVRGHHGAVIDFIDLQWWPVFNAADMAISCGAVVLALLALHERPADGVVTTES